MYFNMLIKTIDREEDLRAKKFRNREEGSCLMETWKRRGDPEKMSEKPGRKVLHQRGNQT